MVGEELCFLRNTVVPLGIGPEVLWTTDALHGVYRKTREQSIKDVFVSQQWTLIHDYKFIFNHFIQSFYKTLYNCTSLCYCWTFPQSMLHSQNSKKAAAFFWAFGYPEDSSHCTLTGVTEGNVSFFHSYFAVFESVYCVSYIQTYN